MQAQTKQDRALSAPEGDCCQAGALCAWQMRAPGGGKGRVMDNHRPELDHVHGRDSRGRTLRNLPQVLKFKTHK